MDSFIIIVNLFLLTLSLILTLVLSIAFEVEKVLHSPFGNVLFITLFNSISPNILLYFSLSFDSLKQKSLNSICSSHSLSEHFLIGLATSISQISGLVSQNLEVTFTENSSLNTMSLVLSLNSSFCFIIYIDMNDA